jgi:MarR family 2-MHQ and catechol resistance regulon transcriptional repressor
MHKGEFKMALDQVTKESEITTSKSEDVVRFQPFLLDAQSNLLTRFAQEFTHAIDSNINTTPDKISVGELRLLRCLQRKGALRLSQLAEELGLPTSTLTYMVGRLEKKNLLIKENDSQDKRAVQIRLLAKAENYLENEKSKVKSLSEKALKNLSSEERAQFSRLIGKALNVLKIKDHGNSPTMYPNPMS